MVNHTVFITGASRGIGLEFVKQYAADGWRVLASCRQPDSAKELQALQEKYSTITIIQLDVIQAEHRERLVKQLKGIPIDLLINNAGIGGKDGWEIGETSWENLQDVFQINAFAPLKITELLVENIAHSLLKQVVFISSEMGSIAENTLGRAYAYRGSKAAANMMMKSLSIDLADRGIKVLMLCPGWVKTDLGGRKADIVPTESVNGMRKIIATIGKEKSGVLYNYLGREIPW